MKKILLTAVTAVLICACGFAAVEKKAVSNAPKVTVAVYADHLQQEIEYWGEIDRECFEKIVSNKLTKGFFRLDNAHWFDRKNEQIVNLKNMQIAGKKAPYTDSLYLRIEDVNCIVELDFTQLEKEK